MKCYFKIAVRRALALFFIISAITGYAQGVEQNIQINTYLAAVDSAFVKNDTSSFYKLVPLEDVKS